MNVFAQFKEQLDIMRKLPLKKLPEHIWMYYKFHLAVLAAVIALTVSLVNVIYQGSLDVLASGMVLNTTFVSRDYSHLTDDYWVYCGSDEKTRTELIETRFYMFRGQPGDDDAITMTTLIAAISARALDYIITAESTLDMLQENDYTLDLRQALTEEELAKLTVIERNGVPIAISLAGTAFAEKYPLTEPDSCIVLVSTLRSPEKAGRFLRYLLWE